MKRHLLLKTMLLLCALIVGSSNGWAEFYTITFGNNASGATAISNTTGASTVISAGTDYVTSKPFTISAGMSYYGDTKTCIRIGKSGESSSLSIALSTTGQVKATSIVVNCNNTGGNKNTGAKLNVNNIGQQTTTTTAADYTFTFASPTDITSITLEGTASIKIYSITVNYSSSPVDVTLSFANSSPSVSLSKGSNTYEATYQQVPSATPSGYNGAITYSIDEENSSIPGSWLVDVDNTTNKGEVSIVGDTNEGATIKVIASGAAVSGVYNAPADVTYTLTVNPYKPAAPTFSTEGGAVDYGTNLTLTSGFPIKYTTDGTDPTSGTTYSAAIPLKSNCTVKAVAVDGEIVSDVASYDFTINTPANVTLSPAGGSLNNKTSVQYGTLVEMTHPLSSLGTIYYTTNGTIPANQIGDHPEKVFAYSSPIAITADIRIKPQFRTDNELFWSASAPDNYYVIATPAAPTPNVTTGTEVAKNTVITLSHELLTNNLGKIYYTETTDGTEPADPTTASTEYTSGITIDVDKKIKARFITNGNHLGEIAALEYSYIREDAGLAYSETNFESPISTSFTKPTLTNPHSLTITYSSSDETIATVDSETGDVTILNKEGDVTIYARSAKDATYYADEASYTITVYDPDRKGSQWNPFTVAEALEYMENTLGAGNTSTDSYYVHGIVSGANNVSSNTQTYFISDDGKENDELRIYKGKYLDGVNFTSSNKVMEGDEVTVYGPLEYYVDDNTSMDMNYGTLTYFKRRLSADLAFGGETNKSVTLTQGDALTDVGFTKADGISLSDITFNASYNDVASVDEYGVITLGGSTGTSVITATFAQNEDYNAGKATCTITVNPAGVTPEPSATGYYEKVTSTSGLVDGGKYLIVNETKKYAFNGNLASESLGGARNYITYTVTDSKINSTDATQNAMVTLNAMENSKWSIKTKNDIYVGYSGTSNGMAKADTPQENTITFSSNNVVITGSGGVQLKFLNQNGSETFKYYSSSQTAVQLYKFVPGEAPSTVDIYVSEAGYATYVSNFTLDYSSNANLKAYIAKEESGEIKFTEVKKVPANTGVLLRATDGGGNTYTVNTTTAETDDMTGNKLVRGTGAAVATGTNPYNYILNVVNNELGFYRANNQTVATNRAYLQTSVTPGALAKIAIIFDDATTSINALDNLTDSQLDNDAPIYNLAGQKVTKAYKGVVIQNGKKLLNK